MFFYSKTGVNVYIKQNDMKQYMYNIVESWCISEVFEFLDDKQLCRMFKLNAKSRKLLESRF